jgi:hypothetical protein
VRFLLDTLGALVMLISALLLWWLFALALGA